MIERGLYQEERIQNAYSGRTKCQDGTVAVGDGGRF
jgi:hypothetical protein